MKLALIGATGLVGQKMIQILEEFNIDVTDFYAVASEKSIGKKIMFNNKEYAVITAEQAIALKPNVALFSAGGAISLALAPKFAAIGCTVIDNSSAWRMDSSKKLIVPEINGNTLDKNDKIIGNPNCSTIQLVLVLNALRKNNKLKRVVVSTYQSVTGTGAEAVKQLMQERNNDFSFKVYPYAIDMNALPHIDVFTENGYTKEEMKIVNETHKILNDNTIGVTATTVRIPTIGGHSESVNIEFENDFSLDEIFATLNKTDGVIVQDSVNENLYPMPITAHNRNEVFVGRIRRDFSQKNTLNCWIVSDNLRKGAATNTVQILQYIIKHNLV